MPKENTNQQVADRLLQGADRTFKIVIINDGDSNTPLPESVFTDKNYEFEHVQITPELSKSILSLHPDLVYINLPNEFDRAQTICNYIKKSESPHIPVLLVAEQDKVKGIQACADDIILKPVNQYELKFRIINLLRIKLLHDQLHIKIEQLEQAQTELQELVVTDALTGLYNYRYFKKSLDTEISRSKRHNLPVSLVMLDIDHFKIYNDKLGHETGNKVLAALAALIKKNVRRIDTVVRYGGEEFALVLPATAFSNAIIAANKIRNLVKEYQFQYQDIQPNQSITISGGIATFPRDAENRDQLIQIADARLYQAKNTGRNKVVSGE